MSKEAKKLDRKRDFGTIQGDSEGRCFEQDHEFFDSEGKLWKPAKKDSPAPTPAPTSAPAPAAAPAPTGNENQLNKQLGN